MRKKLSVLILAATLTSLAGCFVYETPPRVAMVTTITCPYGMQLQSDGMCR
jgi:hypothetical protein